MRGRAKPIGREAYRRAPFVLAASFGLRRRRFEFELTAASFGLRRRRSSNQRIGQPIRWPESDPNDQPGRPARRLGYRCTLTISRVVQLLGLGTDNP